MYYVKNQVTDNNRNGHSNKTLSIGMSRIDIEVTDDRNGGFEPEILLENQTSISQNMQIRPTAFTIGLILYFFITLFSFRYRP